MQVRVLVIERNPEMDDLVGSVARRVFAAPVVDIRRYPPAYGETARPDIVLYDVGALGVPEYVSPNVAGLISDHPGVPVVLYSGLGYVAEDMAEDLREEYPDALIHWCAGLDPVAIRKAAVARECPGGGAGCRFGDDYTPEDCCLCHVTTIERTLSKEVASHDHS